MGSSTWSIAWPEFSTCPRAVVVLPLQHAALQRVCSCVHGLLAHVCVYYVPSSIKPIWMFMAIFDIQGVNVNGLVPFLWTVIYECPHKTDSKSKYVCTCCVSLW